MPACYDDTRTRPSRATRTGGDDETERAEAQKPVQLFAELDDADRRQVVRLFNTRRFGAGETVVREGTGGAAFFLIDEGGARVVVGGQERAALGPGDYFGRALTARCDANQRNPREGGPYTLIGRSNGKTVPRATHEGRP